MERRIYNRNKTGYLVALLGIASLTAVLKLLGDHINPTTVALLLLLVVFFTATRWGSGPAVLASLLGMLFFNFFFLPPVGTFTITNPDNWVALSAFLLTAITAGQLSARSKRRAEEAETRRQEIERLYKQLEDAFERASLAEALKQSDRLKTALLDAVTHDLRTPLTSIKASVTTLLDESGLRKEETVALDAEDRRDLLEVIDEETDRLNRFVEDIVALARIDAGELHLIPHWGSVNDIILAALERAEPLTRNHKVEALIENELPRVRVDERAVAQVVYTLVDNAVKYSAVGTHIQIIAHKEDDRMVRIMVEDQGQSIPPDLRERVFDKFFRAMRTGDSGRSRPSGTGMGLAIAKGIVEAHAGSIWIEDVAGAHGTRVVFTLPIGSDVEADARQVQEEENSKVN